MKRDISVRARAHWDAGRPIEAGRVICEHLDDHERTRWAAELLAVTYLRARGKNLVARLPAVEKALAIAVEPARWTEAKDAFHILQSLMLEAHRKRPPDLLELGLLSLGELVAKVAYNASGSAEPFERNCGWRVPSALRPVLEEIADPVLEQACLARLLGES